VLSIYEADHKLRLGTKELLGVFLALEQMVSKKPKITIENILPNSKEISKLVFYLSKALGRISKIQKRLSELGFTVDFDIVKKKTTESAELKQQVLSEDKEKLEVDIKKLLSEFHKKYPDFIAEINTKYDHYQSATRRYLTGIYVETTLTEI
jgi:hypothetical protein